MYLINKKDYATVRCHEIASILKNSLANRFLTYNGAKRRMDAIKQKYISSSPLKVPHDEECEIVLWVRGYNIEMQIAEGFMGNFMKITIEKYQFKGTNFYKLSDEEIAIELKNHPRRGRPEDQDRSCPDTGHPIIRDILSGREFDNKHEAESFLYRLTVEFGTAQFVTGLDGIRTYIYSKNLDFQKKRRQSWMLVVMQKDNNKFFIDYWMNNYSDMGKFKLFNYGFDLIE